MLFRKNRITKQLKVHNTFYNYIETAISRNSEFTITNNHDSDVNIYATEGNHFDVTPIKNIALSYYKIFDDELEELNKLERIIDKMTEEVKSKEKIRELKMLSELYSKTYYPLSDSEIYSLINTNPQNQEKYKISSNNYRQSFIYDTKQSLAKKSDENLDNTFIIHGSPLVIASDSSLSDNYSTNKSNI